MTETITIALKRAGFNTRRGCDICGESTRKTGVAAEGRDERGGVRVCEECIADPDGIDARLMERAAALRAYADRTEALVGRLKVPSFVEWYRFIAPEYLHGLPFMPEWYVDPAHRERLALLSPDQRAYVEHELAARGAPGVPGEA